MPLAGDILIRRNVFYCTEIVLNPEGNMGWFEGLSGRGVHPGLANITELMNRLGNPQKGMRIIHVTGTDGKGSVCAMMESVLRCSGYLTGMFTSPEILKVNECIRIGGDDVSDEDLEMALETIRPHAEDMAAIGMECTRFEVLTAMALVLFRLLSVEVAVMEVGMGGRLDATNVVDPEVSVINGIGTEHTRFLGSTVGEIALEKAGIAKKGAPCVTINTGEALDAIAAYCDRVGAPLIVVSASDAEVVSTKPDSIDILFEGDLMTIGLPGRFQAGNAVLAMAALSQLADYPERIAYHVSEGLSAVSWPCRMQKHIAMPLIIDVTHTSTGATRLAEDIGEIYGKVVLVIGMLEDKDLRGVCSKLAEIASKIYVTAPQSPRAAPVGRMAEAMAEFRGDAQSFPDVDSALDAAMEERGDDNILVTGSFRMAEEALIWLQKRFARYWISSPGSTSTAASRAGTRRG